MIHFSFYFTSVVVGNTLCVGCAGGGGIIAGGFVEAGTNIFFGSGFFGVTGTHSFSEGKYCII